MTPRSRTVLREVALAVGAGLGSLCLLLAVVAPMFGIRLLVFESGSMAPTVETGGVALTRTVAADQLAVGDIVSVRGTSGSRVTHRVVDIEHSGGQTLLTLQGDANPTPDPEPYPVSEADRVLLHVNDLGFVIDALASPYAMFLAGAFVTALLLVTFRRRVPLTVVVMIVVALVGAGALMPGRVAPTAASFTDAATLSTGNLATTSVAPPAAFNCGGVGLLSVSFNWTAVPDAVNYTLHYGSGGGLTAIVNGTSRTITAAISGGTAWVVANRQYGSTTWSSGASNTRSYTVAVVSLCG